MKIEIAKSCDASPTEPVAKCLNCSKDFVWWLRPIQLCDDCVDLEHKKALEESK